MSPIPKSAQHDGFHFSDEMIFMAASVEGGGAQEGTGQGPGGANGHRMTSSTRGKAQEAAVDVLPPTTEGW